MFCLEIKYSARINFFNSRVLKEKSGLFFQTSKSFLSRVLWQIARVFYLVEFSADVKFF